MEIVDAGDNAHGESDDNKRHEKDGDFEAMLFWDRECHVGYAESSNEKKISYGHRD
jgi:hypothetical protein